MCYTGLRQAMPKTVILGHHMADHDSSYLKTSSNEIQNLCPRPEYSVNKLNNQIFVSDTEIFRMFQNNLLCLFFQYFFVYLFKIKFRTWSPLLLIV